MNNLTNNNGIGVDKNYDSDFCGSIPLHLINLTQPHGMLLVLDSELRIRQISENAADHLGIPAEEFLEKPLAEYVNEAQYEELLAKLELRNQGEKIPFTLSFHTSGEEKQFTALIHTEPAYLLIELEEGANYQSHTITEFFQQIKYATSRLKQTESVESIARVAAEEIKRFTDFDKVLIYQFDKQWNGTVIGQAKEDDMSDFMGLRFPASDIPKQARELYFKSPYRLIPTRDYTPVRLLPVINPLTQRFTDLSDCNLRSVAGVHLEYMANMGIMASMSLPIIIENKLWGIISCHHKTAKNPDFEERNAMELLSSIISSQLAAKERENVISLQLTLRSKHATLLEQLYNSNSFVDGLFHGETNLQELLSLTGAAVSYDGEIKTMGNTPPIQKVKELVSWLRRNSTEQIFYTHHLPHLYPNSKDYKNEASGLIAIPLNTEQGEFILGFREETLQTVNWGGNPDQAIQLEPDGKKYHPRNSFALYQETVKFTSIPWLEEEVAAAETLQNAVMGKIIREKF
ncbi:GAF domain-containing protein [Pontibacter aquaedesilientis]|nr:GAF domain-containing protein [Pontibacter aquaedesilientis]